jgi:hypothetical protein
MTIITNTSLAMILPLDLLRFAVVLEVWLHNKSGDFVTKHRRRGEITIRWIY